MRYGDIRVYDKNFNILAIFPQYISVNWQLYFCEFGSVEIHLEKNAETVALFTENKYLYLVQDGMQAVVTGIQIGTDCAVFGRTPEWLLTKFVLTEFSAEQALADGSIEAATGSTLACLAVKNGFDNICSLTVQNTSIDETERCSYKIDSAKDIYGIVQDCLSEKQFGFSFRFDTKTGAFTFCVQSAAKNSKVIFADELKTSYDSVYTFDLQNEASGGVYYQSFVNMGKWNPETNVPHLAKNPENYGKCYKADSDGTRFGLTIKKDDYLICTEKTGEFSVADEADSFLVTIPAKENGIFSWSAALSADSEDSANQELAQLKAERSVNCKSKNLVYGEDFFLGDLVETRFEAEKFVCCETKIITGVHVWDDAADFGCLPTAEQFQEKENTDNVEEEENGV